MASAQREPGTPLESRLFDEFFRFSFYRAVALLEAFRPEGKRLGEALDPGDEAVRFSVKPGLSFPPSDIANLRRLEPKGQAKMEVLFMGLTGPSGVLPHWYNELMLERARAHDFTMVDFLDIFHHRLISLFYLAWKRTKFTVNYETGGRDRLSWYLLSLIGLGTDGLRGRIGLPEESLIYCSGLLGRSIPSALALESAARYMAGTDAAVDQFVDRMIPLDEADVTSLGLANASLGVDAVCGSFVHDCQSKFRIRLGPVTYQQYCRFLPSGDLLKPIFALVRYMVGIEYEFEVCVVLLAGEVPACRLGSQGVDAPRLGWSTWVKSPEVTLRQDPYVAFEEGDTRKTAKG
jgi:type VI secretion system protein ImpH